MTHKNVGVYSYNSSKKKKSSSPLLKLILKMSSSTQSTSSAIDFLTLCHSLKVTKRTGWVRKEIKNPESIADHMYRMALMALISADMPAVDRHKCIKMAIVHDIAEAKEISELWMEYEENSSPEAKVVKDFDKVEMILQALEYENGMTSIFLLFSY
ncbi:hypothetical protein IFM89_005942 [Coptis chinensis]|uniref:5'-deoxynucleotidase n=1 Tax=Coptis chinensis TaxID=261450 RepID=A0A835I8E7_9MAGN|nr:hypothetical protein IFM89_005942 [Coptis chinensis]